MANKIYVWKGGQTKMFTSQVIGSTFDINDYNFNAPGNWYMSARTR